MVRALMRTENPKTMTRRIAGVGDDEDVHISDCGKYIHAVRNLGASSKERIIKPRYEVGDVLYVREAHRLIDFEYVDDDWNASVQYRADNELGPRLHYLKNGANERTGWRPSIHMPCIAARNFLLLMAVRPERLHDITEADALAEGVCKIYDHLSEEKYREWRMRLCAYQGIEHDPGEQWNQSYKNYLWHGDFGSYGMGNKQSDAWEYQYSGYDSARDSFSSLWELLNAKRGHGWAKNDWVYAYTFERAEKPADWEG
jgi:hypothetical protein